MIFTPAESIHSSARNGPDCGAWRRSTSGIGDGRANARTHCGTASIARDSFAYGTITVIDAGSRGSSANSISVNTPNAPSLPTSASTGSPSATGPIAFFVTSRRPMTTMSPGSRAVTSRIERT